MTPPARVGPNRVWLGRYTDAETAGWLETIEVNRAHELGYFDRKATIGDPTASSDDYISEWIVGDFKGGGQIEDMNETSETDRFWTAILDTRDPNKNALPPLVHTSAPSGATGRCFPLGDVYDDTTHRVQTFYAAFDDKVHGYDEANAAWYPANATALAADPVAPGTAFRGTGATTKLFIPCGATGYATIVETSAGVATVANVAADATHPGAVALSLWANKLYAIDAGGQLWFTVDAAAWTAVTDSAGTACILDPSRLPRHLLRGVDRTGKTVLYVVSDADVSTFNANAGVFEETNVVDFVHPDFGLAAIHWRPGEDLWVSIGPDAVRLTGPGVIVPNAGPARDDGLPIQFARGAIVSFASTNKCLYALLKSDPAADSEEVVVEEAGTYYDEASYVPDAAGYALLMGFTGQGWHGLWQSTSSDLSPTWAVVSRVPTAHRLWWGADDTTARQMKLRTGFHNSRQGFQGGSDEFAPAGHLHTPRFDAGMLGFRKKASHVSVFMDHATADEQLEIAYRTAADIPAGGFDPGFPHRLGTVTAADETVLGFDPNADDFAEGQAFRWIQFEVTMRRRTDGDNPELHTPLWRAMVMHFRKIPQNTTAHTLSIVLHPDNDLGKSAEAVRSRLRDLIEADEFLALVIDDTGPRRVDITGISGFDDPGRGDGARSISLIELHSDA